MYSKYGKTKMFTWFFAFLTMFIIALVLILQVGFTVDAKTISGVDGEVFTKGSGTDNNKTWSFDSDDVKSVKDIFGIENDFSVLTFYDNPDKVILNDSNPNNIIYNLNYFYHVNYENQSDRITSVTPIINNFEIPETFTYDGVQYNATDFQYIYFVNASLYEQYVRCILTNSELTLVGGQNLCAVDGFCFVNGGVNCQINGLSDFSYNDVSYKKFNQCNNARLICGNYNYMANSKEYLPNNSLSDWGEFVDYNYNHSSVDYGSGGSDNSDYEYNLIMPDGDWDFKVNGTYNAPYNANKPISNVYPIGNITYTFTPTDYQVTHANDFYLEFGTYFEYSIKYQNTGLDNINPPFYGTIGDSWKAIDTRFYPNYTDDYGTLDTYRVSLSDFIRNGNSESFTWQTAFDYFVGKTETNNKTLVDCLNISKDCNQVNYSKFNINCYVFLTYEPTGNSSGEIWESFNPITKSGKDIDKSGDVNPNPKPTPEDEDTDPPEDETSNNTKNGNININITNNNTNNGGTGTTVRKTDESSFWDIFNPVKMFFGNLMGKNTTYKDEIADSFGSNSWLSFINSSFSNFSPFITLIITYFTISLGILVVAFIIRIILDLL